MTPLVWVECNKYEFDLMSHTLSAFPTVDWKQLQVSPVMIVKHRSEQPISPLLMNWLREKQEGVFSDDGCRALSPLIVILTLSFASFTVHDRVFSNGKEQSFFDLLQRQ